MPQTLTAAAFIRQLETLATPEALKSYERSFALKNRGDDVFIGVPMGKIFALAKEYIALSLNEIEKLLESPVHEVRVGAVSIMDFQARSKKTSPEQRKALFDLYLRRHDRINTWDLVDRSAIYVVGSYMADKPRDILYKLARSKDMNERRTAAVATLYFIMKQDDVVDAFGIAELLVHEQQELTQKAAGWALREAGKRDPKKLVSFLNAHAATMPRPMLRNAVERLPRGQKDYYVSLKKQALTP